MAFNITAACGNTIASLPDSPTCSAQELKEYFDNIPAGIATSVNSLISALESSTGASNIGTASGSVQSDLTALSAQTATIGDISDTGITGSTVSAQLNNISTEFLRYQVVTEVPANQESGVLYIVEYADT